MANPSVQRSRFARAITFGAGLLLFAAPGFADKVVALGAGWRDERLPGPTRDELLSIVAG